MSEQRYDWLGQRCFQLTFCVGKVGFADILAGARSGLHDYMCFAVLLLSLLLFLLLDPRYPKSDSQLLVRCPSFSFSFSSVKSFTIGRIDKLGQSNSNAASSPSTNRRFYLFNDCNVGS